MKYYALCIINYALLLMLSGCIEEYEAEIDEEDTDMLVVKGTICSGELNKFYLLQMQALNSPNTPQTVMGAKVSVRGSDGSEYPAQATNGYYACMVGDLNPNVDYYLHIGIGSEVYESEPQKPLPTEKIADVRGSQNTPESNIDILVTPDEPFEPDKVNYYSWTYDETWEVHPDYRTLLYYDIEKMEPVIKHKQFPECGWIDATGKAIMVGASTSYGGQHIRRLKLYDIDRSDTRMFYRYSGLIQQRAITKAEYEYELARHQAGSEMGGLFTPLPSTPPANIHCLTSGKQVIGFIGCSLNTSKYRFFLNSGDFSIRRPLGNDTREWLDNPSVEDCLKMARRGMFLCEWILPEMSDDHMLHAAWAYPYQLDVRIKYKEAYIEEPDFWSLEENVSY